MGHRRPIDADLGGAPNRARGAGRRQPNEPDPFGRVHPPDVGRLHRRSPDAGAEHPEGTGSEWGNGIEATWRLLEDNFVHARVQSLDRDLFELTEKP